MSGINDPSLVEITNKLSKLEVKIDSLKESIDAVAKKINEHDKQLQDESTRITKIETQMITTDKVMKEIQDGFYKKTSLFFSALVIVFAVIDLVIKLWL